MQENLITETGARVLDFPFSRDGFAIPGEYAVTQAQDELVKVRMWDGSLVWLASRYEHVRAILGDIRFSSSARHENYPSPSPARGAVTAHDPDTMLRLDAPDHTALRRMFTAEFSHKRIQALQPQIDAVIAELIGELERLGPPTDFMRDFALPLPSKIIATILGVPYEDHAFFQHCTEVKLDLDASPEAAVQAGRDQRDYVRRLLHRMDGQDAEQDNLLGRMLHKHVRTGELSMDDAIANVELLIIAGHETTANMTALGMLALLLNREAFAAVGSDEDGRKTAQIVEEMLRFFAIVQLTGVRVAIEDVEIGGVTIRAGEGILAMITPANHDPRKFPAPDMFDIDRPKVPPHVAFGFGAHQCLGQTLARAELVAAFRALTRSFPDMRLAQPMDTLSFKGNSFVHGVRRLPVAW